MKLLNKSINYVGLEEPRSPAELEIEILGLRNAVQIALELISRFEQASALAKVMSAAGAREGDDGAQE